MTELLRRISRRARRPITSRVAADIDRVFRIKQRELFDREESADGTPWQPVTPALAAYKRENNLQILIDSGRLFRSLTRTNRSNSEHLFRFTPRRLDIGTTVPYAIYQQRVRPFLPDVSRESARILARYLVTGRTGRITTSGVLG